MNVTGNCEDISAEAVPSKEAEGKRRLIKELRESAGDAGNGLDRESRAAIDEAADAIETMQWQPIETAPKERWILIADDVCWPPDLVRWQNERKPKPNIDGYMTHHYPIPAGWFMSPGGRSRFDAPEGHLMRATRWADLPALLVQS